MKIAAMIFLLFSFSFIKAQTVFQFSNKDKPLLKRQLTEAIGSDLKILDYVVGDISRDGRKDIIAIAENENDKSENRKIFLFVNQKNNLFSLRGVNSNIIECAECGGSGVGDPYQKTVIAKNYFSFELLYGACDKERRVITFTYNAKFKNFFLYRDVSDSYSCNQETNSRNEIKIKRIRNNAQHYRKLKFENYKQNF